MMEAGGASDREGPYFARAGQLAPVVGLAGRLSGRARERRFERFLRTIRPGPDELLLDVGCGSSWSLAELAPEAAVTGVDLAYRGGFEGPRQAFVAADACELPFADGSFDVAYSNSLVEHIDRGRRQRFADEIRRVARRWWVQTPNLLFPLEPHALLPGVQLLPPALRRPAWRLSPRRIPYEDSLELLGRRELASLFGESLILEERVGPFVKSLIAVGPATAFAPRDGSRP